MNCSPHKSPVTGGRASARALSFTQTPVRAAARGHARLPGGLALAGAALVLLLAACSLPAQEPDAAALTNASPDAMLEAATNEAMQVDDLISAIRSLPPADATPDDAGGTNGPMQESLINESGPGSSTNSQAWRRPTGRESRDRWSSRQRSNSAWSSSHSASLPATPPRPGPAGLDYSAFHLIVERNIFDPNRRPHQPSNHHESTPPGRASDYFTLVGTMSYNEGTFAFFSGSSADYQEALKRGGNIAGYTVAAIGSDSVKLALGTNQVDLRIGMQMRHDGDGSWFATDAPSSYTVSSFEPTSAPTSSPASGNASSGLDSEILKRMMERREKE